MRRLPLVTVLAAGALLLTAGGCTSGAAPASSSAAGDASTGSTSALTSGTPSSATLRALVRTGHLVGSARLVSAGVGIDEPAAEQLGRAGAAAHDPAATRRPADHDRLPVHRRQRGDHHRDPALPRGLGDPGRHQPRRAGRDPVGDRQATFAGTVRQRAVHRHRPGGRSGAAAAGPRIRPHPERRRPGWPGAGHPAAGREGLGTAAAGGGRRRQPRPGARHRAGGLRLEPADRRPRPRVRPHPGDRDLPRARVPARHARGGRRARRQALPGPRPGSGQHRHHVGRHRRASPPGPTPTWRPSGPPSGPASRSS